MLKRKFLYISPYFPPQSQVGALRPLKFARHLPGHGWFPVVLADLSPFDEIDTDLEKAIPANVEVVRNYSKSARKTESQYYAAVQVSEPTLQKRPCQVVKRKIPTFNFLQEGIKRYIPKIFSPGPEFVPLGHHSLNIPHAIKASRELLSRGGFEAIVVNADPWASLLVGAHVSKESDVPLILDFRDPWSVCDVRRQMRSWPQRKLNDRLEKRAVEAASKVILNTQTALDAYRQHYRELPADLFAVIHNHGDAKLSSAGRFDVPEVFTMLYLGRFRRFVEGYQLLKVLGELKRRGYDGAQVQLIVTGHFWVDTRKIAEDLDIEDMLVDHPPVSYTQVGSLIKTMDLLITLSSLSKQRIPSKFYDYAVSDRPILSISDNPEIGKIATTRFVEGVYNCPLNDISSIADVIEHEIGRGRRRQIDRKTLDLDSAAASAKLAAILNEISAK